MQLSMDAFLTPTETPNQSAAANRAGRSDDYHNPFTKYDREKDRRGVDLISNALTFGRRTGCNQQCNRLREISQPITSRCLLQSDRLDPRVLQKHLAISPTPLPSVAGSLNALD